MNQANMNEVEFDQCCDDVMLAIEEAIDLSGEDIDYEISAGVLTLTIEANGSKVIVSRQPALCQIWVAAKSGGYYFNRTDSNGSDSNNNDRNKGSDWVCTTTGESLGELLQRVCSEQEGGEISFDV
jgi:CyaY protein